MSSTQARSEMGLNVIRLSAFGMLLIFPATSEAQQSPPITEQIAKTYGLDSFGQIEAIRYTFNVESPNLTVSRSWEWSPKTDTVSYEGKDKEGKPVKASYQRAKLSSQSDAIKNEIDPAFANDQYWLLLPFHVLWDGATATSEGNNKLPVGDGGVPLNGSWSNTLRRVATSPATPGTSTLALTSKSRRSSTTAAVPSRPSS